MAARKPRAVIFDIGNVLVRVDPSRALTRLAGSASLSPQEIWLALQKDPRWRDWQEGRIAPRDWHRHLTRRLGGDLSFDEFCAVWNSALIPAPILGDPFLASLARRHRLAVLSNTDPIHIGYVEANYTFFRYFPVRIYSCSVGASKPDPSIYKETLRGCGVTAPEAIYIDDVAAYVDAAQRLGIGGIVFSSPDQLVAELGSRGLL